MSSSGFIGTTTLPTPRIIPRKDHPISRKSIDPEALKVLYRLHSHGFIAYLVGGSVRDLLLGRRPKDFDVGTDAHPGQVRALFRNSRIIGRRFRLVQVFFHGHEAPKIIEVSTFRRLPEPEEDEVLRPNNTFGTPAEDALRRDLTINALFYNIADYSIVDYVGGLEDLNNGIIRAVGDPDVRFRRDPVRVLRAVRHAARTGFTIEPATLAAVERHRHEISICPPSRVRDELMRDLKGGAAAAWLELAHSTGVLYALLPTLEPYYAASASALRARAREIMAKVDELVAAGKDPGDAVVVAAMVWAVLEEEARGVELGRGRAGRARWNLLVRDVLPRVLEPVAFAKKVVERACQIAGVIGYSIVPGGSGRLPKRVKEKGYFGEAVELAGIVGAGLKAMAQPPPIEVRRRIRRARRRRARRRRKHGRRE